MCTVILALDVHPEAPLIVAANRDEFLARPTAPFGTLRAATGQRPALWGGRDLLAGGTWFAVRKDGAMALLTNVRPGTARDDTKRSRGEIVEALLEERDTAAMRARMRSLDARSYNPFNVLFGVGGAWAYASSDRLESEPVGPGVHVLGNTFLDDPDDAKTALVADLNLTALPLVAARARLVDLLAGELFLELAGYGTRWSMFYAGPHAPIAQVEIAETSVHRGPLVAMELE
jgi:uncharacterized protein with NRDE domain